MYVRNASGLVRDGARLLHILMILSIVIWISNRNIIGILILYSSKGLRNHGYIMLSRNICTKANTTVLSDKFHISTVFFTNGFIDKPEAKSQSKPKVNPNQTAKREKGIGL